MKQPEKNGELFPDPKLVRETLERQTRDALLQRFGPMQSDHTSTAKAPHVPDRSASRGIGFGVDLVRAILEGRKTQTRRLIRPLPEGEPPTECPAARVGEVLYVREPWLRGPDGHTQYAADEARPTGRKFRPAMYMARSAARLFLSVTSIRTERLQSITDDDLAAEGLPPGQSLAEVWDGFYTGPGERYAANPWVWVIAFTRQLP